MARKKTNQAVAEEPKQAPVQEEAKEVIQPVEEEKAEIVSNGTKRIKVSSEQLMQLQKSSKLVGYNPATQEAIVKA